MDDRVDHPALRCICKDNGAELGTVEGLTNFLVLKDLAAKMCSEFLVGRVARFDDKTGEDVAVDDRDVEREDGGDDGGFS